MRNRPLPLVTLTLAVLAVGWCASVSTASAPPSRTAAKPARVPQGFIGMNVDGPLLDEPVNLDRQFGKMVSAGVESLRVAFNWAAAQPTRTGPVDFTQTDAIVGAAASHGLSVLPVVLYAPGWDAARHPAGTLARPARTGPYANYLKLLVGRYGPRGSYWREHRGTPRHAIRMWQIWNEPNFSSLWPTQPFAPTYVKLLRAAHDAIKRADHSAKVVLAGIPNQAWRYLAQIYAVRGARRAFDVVAAHPYTAEPRHVIDFLGLVRAVMRHNGDGDKPLLATETGWNSSRGHHPSDDFCCQTTERGQVHDISAVLPLLASHRRSLHLLGFYYYTWVAQEYTNAPSFNFAGLFNFSHGRLLQKPSFEAFRRGALALERCRRKGALATRCQTPR